MITNSYKLERAVQTPDTTITVLSTIGKPAIHAFTLCDIHAMKRYFQKQLQGLILDTPFCRRMFRKFPEPEHKP